MVKWPDRHLPQQSVYRQVNIRHTSEKDTGTESQPSLSRTGKGQIWEETTKTQRLRMCT